MKGPKRLCIDRDGSVIIADAENNLIRRYVPGDGKISRVAGTRKYGDARLDGPPVKAELRRPHGVLVDRSGSLYIVEGFNNRVLKVEK